ncbi:hypothetical protein BDU57DRAFT_584665 [Ampelomyces quisqualis]|uniref:MARVEL domain-containing protein n=1 Tax=Ampelomyces quisqualis TaxID=50730 RepID=A0A6A5R0K5_AMPQU|nr:hypothetical protein BDU57DRAFT_584665 [Ampelomyces quisqualis]
MREHFPSRDGEAGDGDSFGISFKAAINSKIDNPIVALFLLSVRFLQFAFAGISYAIELAHGHISHPTTFVYAQVVFGLTLLTLTMEKIMIRYYRVTWMVEWGLAILWFVSFAVFYEAYLEGARMKRAVWCDLISALLWLGSAIFSFAMCCIGMKAAIRCKIRERRQRKDKKSILQKIGEMESGTIDTGSA